MGSQTFQIALSYYYFLPCPLLCVMYVDVFRKLFSATQIHSIIIIPDTIITIVTHCSQHSMNQGLKREWLIMKKRKDRSFWKWQARVFLSRKEHSVPCPISFYSLGKPYFHVIWIPLFVDASLSRPGDPQVHARMPRKRRRADSPESHHLLNVFCLRLWSGQPQTPSAALFQLPLSDTWPWPGSVLPCLLLTPLVTSDIT